MIKKIISNTIMTILFLAVGIIVFFAISAKINGGEPKLFGYELKAVLSGSMEPTFRTGSIIAVYPLSTEESKQLKKNDIITFKINDTDIVTHRIVKVVNNGQNVQYETKGDNNKTKDFNPVLSKNVIAKYNGFTIPYLGYLIDYSKSKMGSALLFIIPGLIFLAYFAVTLYQFLREIEAKGKDKSKNETIA